MLIYTCLEEGRVLPYEVLEGIVKNGCDLMLTTNKEFPPSDKYKAQNIQRLLKDFKDDYFIFIDSDVVMTDKDTITKMKLALTYNPIVTVPTKPGHIKANFPDVMPHAICGIRSDYIDIFKFYLKTDGCTYCNFLKVHQPAVLWDLQAYELKK